MREQTPGQVCAVPLTLAQSLEADSALAATLLAHMSSACKAVLAYHVI